MRLHNGSVSVILLVLLLVSQALPQALPPSGEITLSASGPGTKRLSCGRNTILLDLRRTTAVGAMGDPTRIRIFGDGRVVWSLSAGEPIVDAELVRPGVVCRSLTGDGVPVLIFTTYSLGAHCCTTIYVLSLGSKPKVPLKFNGGNASSYELRDVKGDGSLQLVLSDDSFAYFGGLCYACSPHWLPLVACYRHGSFEDCTRQFPRVIQENMQQHRAWLNDVVRRIKSGELEDSETWPADTWIAGPLLGLYANSLLLGQDEAGWRVIRSRVKSKKIMRWFECNRPTVQRWANRRQAILHSPDYHAIWETPGCRNIP